ncbi:PREDICTED: stress response protein nst1 [Theobroma cacao]|uniref:Stress response protein nst1 n=1 Tax=Theobroma cacao TaxID=3641 RepID=A0AB32V8M9_THECC|nr:PREDICTED: stress response protein nst1 [Theobroma cacao]
MCILCVIQKWSRRVATMLPWLVIPLIGLWALSQLLPPDFRFEITSPRLACVFVLLVTLFWYEILMPQLSAWRVRRNARLRERKRSEAIELQKLRKTATRRCRNCQTPYRDQNPGGGRFMCSYCGHISKRPVLDLPVPPGLGISNSGIIKDLVGKGGKILNGKGWSDNGWMCGQDWLENGNWVTGSVAGKSSYWRKNGSGVFGDEDCLAEKSYSGVVIFVCKLLTSFFLSISWLWRKIFRVSSSRDDTSSDADRGMLTKRGENGTSFHESRGEKARRKAEEKRQARLEKELWEEEERKQREEVARLVEERRRLRDEKLEAEKDRSILSPPSREKEIKKEAEKKRQERRKEKDKASSKSNSDAEEIEKRAGKETERKRDIDKKSEIDRRENQKSGTDNVKGNAVEAGYGMKNTLANNFTRGNAGTRYLDRMRGTFLSSSKAFSGSSFFGKSTNSPATVTKENKPNNSVDHVHTSAHRRDFCPAERVAGKLSMNGDDKNVNTNHSVLSEPQPRAAPKKTWQQLFTRSSSVPPASNTNVISRPNSKVQAEAQSPPLPGHSSTIQMYDNPINFGLPSPFTSTYSNGAPSSSLGFSPAIEPIFPRAGEGLHELIPEEPELFEDPCYVPDPVSLLGPVSESLDNFQLDLGSGFGMDNGMERPHTLKNISASSEISKPSPIESPLSRLRSADERHNNSNRLPTTPKAQDLHSFPVDGTNGNEKGTWQMWNSSPLGQDGLGLVGGPASWLFPLEHNRSNKEDFVHPPTQKTMASLFTKEDPILAGTQSPQKVFLGSGQNGGTFSPVTGPTDQDPWLQNAFFPPLSGSDDHFPIKPREELSEMTYGSPSGSACTHPFELSPVNCWPKKEWAMQGPGEVVGKSSVARPHVGGLFPTPDVQSLW